ncbi:MAG: HAD hydrolase family protein [Deltaproteobacteria bacterium]|nr:HAD hydrolase family protein [Deltaproteobacteria bacterium]
MTDGSIIYDSEGREIKVFNVRDVHGIKMLKRGGVDCALLTARTSQAVKKRAEELEIGLCYQGAIKKLTAYEDILKKTGLAPGETAFIGDDLVDLPVIRRAGFSAAVQDAVREVREAADYVTLNPGGKGAVREVAEIILKIKGKWHEVTERYLK